MKIFFSASDTAVGRAIRTFESSEFNHTGFVMPDGRILQTTMSPGVHVSSSLHAYRESVSKFVLYDLIVPNEQAGLNFLYAQLGKGYDISAIVGFMFWRDWSEDDEWYCSELLAKWYEVVGWPIEGAKNLSRVPVRLTHAVTHALCNGQQLILK